MEIRVNGLSRDLFSFATALTAAGEKGLSRELDRGLRDAAQIVIREVERTTDDYMPSGYEQPFKSSLDLKVQQRAVSAHRVTIVGIGRSKAKGRDVRALDEGRLRHPVYGRYRVQRRRNAVTKTVSGKQLTIAASSAYKNPWVEQRIPAGWFSTPFERARPAALKEIQAAMDRTVDKINKRT